MEFCDAHGISEGFYYKLKKQRKGPRELRLGTRTLITFESAAEWRRAREGFPQDMLDEEMRKIAVSVKRLDDHLRDNEWLAGGMYTLADICNFSIANGMQFGFSELVRHGTGPSEWPRRW